MPHHGLAFADGAATPGDLTPPPFSSSCRFRISENPEASGVFDTFVQTACGKGLAKGVRRLLKRHTAAFQLLGVDDGTLKTLASSCGEGDVTYGEVMAFLGAKGYEEFMTDKDVCRDSELLMVVMKKPCNGRADAPAALQPSSAFVRLLPYRHCATY